MGESTKIIEHKLVATSCLIVSSIAKVLVRKDAGKVGFIVVNFLETSLLSV